jgi:hypothetical protein
MLRSFVCSLFFNRSTGMPPDGTLKLVVSGLVQTQFNGWARVVLQKKNMPAPLRFSDIRDQRSPHHEIPPNTHIVRPTMIVMGRAPYLVIVRVVFLRSVTVSI